MRHLSRPFRTDDAYRIKDAKISVYLRYFIIPNREKRIQEKVMKKSKKIKSNHKPLILVTPSKILENILQMPKIVPTKTKRKRRTAESLTNPINIELKKKELAAKKFKQMVNKIIFQSHQKTFGKITNSRQRFEQ